MKIIGNQPRIEQSGKAIIAGIEDTGETVHKKIVNTASIQYSEAKIIHKD